jgi:ATP-binding cassette subfamily B protein
LFCVTHDISETAGFDRVIVIDRGRIVEQGAPAALAAREGSRYRELLAAESVVRERLWANPSWRTVRLEEGRTLPQPPLRVMGGRDARRPDEDEPRQHRVTV